MNFGTFAVATACPGPCSITSSKVVRLCPAQPPLQEAGEKKKLKRPVLANIDDNDVWRVGFITQSEADDFGFTGYVAVYIPMSYSIAGNVYLLPASRVRMITDITATDAMKFAISGGVTHVHEEESEKLTS